VPASGFDARNAFGFRLFRTSPRFPGRQIGAGMEFDARAFRDALGCFPTGVAVITAESADRPPMGITVNSFASVSLEPPLVLWCIDRRSDRSKTFVRAESFTISVLDAAHREVSARLARPGAHRLDDIALLPTELGPPALADALAVFECNRESVHEGGDHAILIGRVLRFAFRPSGEPLVFFRGRYGTFGRSL
jgi:flavin reductase (DIM6/NTAB) family NADH-FMN oxidoreductase RutF